MLDETQKSHQALPYLTGLPLVHSHVKGLLSRVDDVETGLLIAKRVYHMPLSHIKSLLFSKLLNEVPSGLNEVFLELRDDLVLPVGLNYHVLALLHTNR